MPRFTKSQKQPDERQLLAYAGWLLARREYAAAELLTKFRTRFIADEPLFARVIEKLVTLGVQSDERAARVYIEGHPGWGPQKITFQLRQRGIAPALIASILAEADDEEARAREALALKLRGQPVPPDFRERQKLIAFLARRGFSLDIAKRVAE